MKDKPWYEKLFENYARGYDQEPFTFGTLGECDFIEQEILHDKTLRILDIGCGTGRHSIELAKRGYRVTGIDLSQAQLNMAVTKASQQNVEVEFLQCDARHMPFDQEFDLAIMLCEGGFSLMETDEMNFQILQQAARAIKPGSKFIFTTLNGLFPLFHSVQEFMDAENHADGTSYNQHNFDLMTFRMHDVTKITDDDGNVLSLDCTERFYVPTEITWLLKSLDFSTVEIFGARLGAFSRHHSLATSDFEMLVVAQKHIG